MSYCWTAKASINEPPSPKTMPRRRSRSQSPHPKSDAGANGAQGRFELGATFEFGVWNLELADSVLSCLDLQIPGASASTDFSLAFCEALPKICPPDMSSPATGSTRMIEFLAWMEVNKKKMLIGVAVVAGAIAAYAIYQWYRNEAEMNAAVALYKIQTPVSQRQQPQGPGAQAFL